jgi:dipeptidyl aminopeptidase/acylaminoacyl peptidase
MKSCIPNGIWIDPMKIPEGYKLNSLLQYAPNLEGRLLMIHGADDNVVVWQHSMMFLKNPSKPVMQI